jgi:hypothetical protein
MSRLLRLVVLALVLLCVVGLPVVAMWNSNGQWMRTRQDDELIAVAMASKDPTIGVVYLLKDANTIDSQSQKVKALGGTVKHVDPKIGYLRTVVPTPAARKALEVSPGDVASIDVDLSFHQENSEGNGWYQEPTDGHQFEAEMKTEATRAFLKAQSPIAHDLGADAWRKEHPTFDGRGIVIADVENLLDPSVPQLSGALSLDGKPVRKIQGMHILVEPGDHATLTGNDNASQWVDMHEHVNGATAPFDGHEYHLPPGSDFRIGKFDLPNTLHITYWLNPETLKPAIGDGIFAVLWEPASGKVWVDEKHSYDFRNAKPMHDYNENGEFSFFGSKERSAKYPMITPYVSYVVLIDKAQESVALGLCIGDHAVGVSTSAAGNSQGPDDPVHGVAPAAQVASFEYSAHKLHAQAEAMIAAAEDPKVDVIVYEWAASIHTTSEEGWFMGALNQRLVQTFDKPIFVPGDNQPALGSIDDAGIGPDVIAVSGSQSADSYWLYDGFRPSVAIHKHWGGLTDGPGQDGRLKPDLLAPSGYTAAVQSYLFEEQGHRKPGIYTLPRNRQRFGGTSQATPTAGGAAALLLSAAKQSGLHVHASQLADAMRVGARMSSDLYAHEQGNGLIDVATSWKVLTGEAHGTVPPLIQPCGGSVRTARWPTGAPDGGRGVFEEIGWHPGDSGSRSMQFCFNGGARTDLTAALLLNDGTYDLEGVKASGDKTEVSLRVHPSVAGFHSTIVELKDKGGQIVGRGMATIAASAPLNEGNKYKVEQKIVVPRPGYTGTFVEVPPGTDALVIKANAESHFAVAFQDPSGTDYRDVPFGNAPSHSITIPSPIAGAWEIMLEDTHDPWEGTRSLIPVEPQTVTLTVQAVRADRGAAANKSLWADLPVREVGSVTSLASQAGQFPSTDPVLVPIDVPTDTGALLVDLSGSDDQVDAYILNCVKSTCAPHARLLGAGENKRMTISNPEVGHWVVALDNYDPMRNGAGLPNFHISVLAYNRFGNPSTDVEPAGRAYEVNCQPSGSAVMAAPSCGLFIATGH